MTKYFPYLLTAFIFLLIPVSTSALTKLSVTCSYANNKCTISPPNTPLFSETDVKPGYNFYASLSIGNSTTGDCYIYLQATKDAKVTTNLDTVLLNKITRGNTLLFNQPLSGLFGATSPVYLDKIPSSSTYLYDWKMTMDPLAGNTFQANHLFFDLPITIKCDKQPCGCPPACSGPTSSPRPTNRPLPTPTHKPSPTPTSKPQPTQFQTKIHDYWFQLELLFKRLFG
jgi:hypothetical protein